jgi:uncharacterized membrane protein HdeD (DUF308 family)
MTIEATRLKSLDMPWWLVLLEGIAAIILGILLLTAPQATLFVLVQLLGIYWLIKGIFQIVSIFIDSSRWGWKLFAGVLGIVAGIFILRHPMLSAVVTPALTVFFVGLLGVTIGVINLIQAFQGGGWGAGILGALSILLGIFLTLNPLMGTAALSVVLGVLGLVGGVAAIVLAFRMR